MRCNFATLSELLNQIIKLTLIAMCHIITYLIIL